MIGQEVREEERIHRNVVSYREEKRDYNFISQTQQRYGVAGSSGGTPHGKNQCAARAFEEQRERYPLPLRLDKDGRTKEAAFGVSPPKRY
jgi:hypothetical protein